MNPVIDQNSLARKFDFGSLITKDDDAAACEIIKNIIADGNYFDNTTQRQYNSSIAHDRKQQVGSGQRGDKIRTYRFHDDVVQDHITGKRSSVRRVLSGNFDLLWN